MSGKELARLGDIIDAEVDPRDDRIDELERQVARLRGDLSDARHELTRVREDSNRALTALRRQLSPLYGALQRVFGELDAAGIADVEPVPVASPTAAPAPNARVSAVWDSWKEKLGSNTAPARVIDALLGHGELNVAQLKVAAKMANQTVYDAIHRLNKLGLINKNGGRFSLKAL